MNHYTNVTFTHPDTEETISCLLSYDEDKKLLMIVDKDSKKQIDVGEEGYSDFPDTDEQEYRAVLNELDSIGYDVTMLIYG